MARRKYPFHMVVIVAGLAGFYFWKKRQSAQAALIANQDLTISSSITGTSNSVASH